MNNKNSHSSPLISILLPIYNAEKYLSEAIESMLNQTHKNIELILINDGSTDSSLKIINKWSEIDPRIIIINRDNKGLIYSLNQAISVARGDFIARMDADDISLPTRLEKQLEYLIENNLDICGCDYFEINEDGELAGLRLVPKNNDMMTICLASAVPFAHPSVLIRKSFLIDNNLKYGDGLAKYAEDLDLWIKMYNVNAKFGNVSGILFKYRLVANSLSKVRRKKILSDSANLFSEFYKKNKYSIEKSLKRIPSSLNKYEQEWVSSVCMKRVLRLSFKGTMIHANKIPKKILLSSLLSELNRIFKI